MRSSSFRLALGGGAGAVAIALFATQALAAGGVGGIWVNTQVQAVKAGPHGTFHIADGQPIPLKPAAAKTVAEHLRGRDGGQAFVSNHSVCLPDGMPTATAQPPARPFQILDGPDQVTVLSQSPEIYRLIRIGIPHLPDPDPSFMGDNIGHRDGDTLVVDTIGITTDAKIFGVIPHGEAMHVTEHMRRTGPTTLEDRVTVEDPDTFTKPWTFVSRLKLAPPGKGVDKTYCDPPPPIE